MAQNNTLNQKSDVFTATTSYAGTFDTNVAAAGVTLSGTTIAADGTDANIDITMTPKGTGTVNPSALSVNSAYTFPVADGTADQVLTTDGSGAVSWAAGGGGGGGLTYEAITADTKTIVVDHEYGANRADGVSFTLPATAAVGTRFAITGILGLWDIIQGASQYIGIGSSTSTVGAGGSLTATNLGDCITCTCIEANVGWRVTSMMGNLTVV